VENAVVKFPVESLYNDIQVYFNELMQHSINTKINYERDIREFFRFDPTKKEVEHLTQEDVQRIRKTDLINFRNYLLQEKENSNATVNRKLRAVKSFFNHFASELDIDMNIFNFRQLRESGNRSYDPISFMEAEKFAEQAYANERQNGLKKKLLLKFAARTSLRLSECLNIDWNDLKPTEEGYVKVFSIQKGKKEFETAISIEFYNELLLIKGDDPKLFSGLKKRAVETMIQRIKKNMGYPEDKRIVFHSFRGVAINYEYDTTGDMKKAMLQGNHSSSSTTLKYYLDKEKDLASAPGVRMDKKEDRTFLNDITREQFIEFFSKVDTKTINELKRYIEN